MIASLRSVLAFLLGITTLLFSHPVTAQELASWQNCATFMAPTAGGWAVFAARDFKTDEIVELTPFFIPLFKHETQHSALDHYVFGFTRDGTILNTVLLGNGAFYNHHEQPNLKYIQVIKPGDDDDIPHMVGFRATRDIAAGEQLYISYGSTEEWFEKRGLDGKHWQRSMCHEFGRLFQGYHNKVKGTNDFVNL